jgi:hypothetical protein
VDLIFVLVTLDFLTCILYCLPSLILRAISRVSLRTLLMWVGVRGVVHRTLTSPPIVTNATKIGLSQLQQQQQQHHKPPPPSPPPFFYYRHRRNLAIMARAALPLKLPQTQPNNPPNLHNIRQICRGELAEFLAIFESKQES